LSTEHGYHPTAAGKALKRPWPALEAIIAEAINVAPWEIWPSRYLSKEADTVPRSTKFKKK
jgi:Ner family transcriptional regulator